MLVIVGPCSSGKSRLLKEVLVGKNKRKGLVAFVDGRSQRLTDGGVMAQVLKDQGAKQIYELKQNHQGHWQSSRCCFCIWRFQNLQPMGSPG